MLVLSLQKRSSCSFEVSSSFRLPGVPVFSSYGIARFMECVVICIIPHSVEQVTFIVVIATEKQLFDDLYRNFDLPNSSSLLLAAELQNISPLK